jgi:hypothetical protein
MALQIFGVLIRSFRGSLRDPGLGTLSYECEDFNRNHTARYENPPSLKLLI